MKISICGDIYSSTGYAIHTRQLSKALHDAGVDVALECPRPAGWEFGCPDWLFQALTKNYKHEATLMINLPPYYDFKWADGVKKLIGFVVFEGTKVPAFWLRHLKLCDQLWVPSEHVKDALLNTFKQEELPPTFIVPHGVDHSLFYPKKVERDKRFTFLMNKGWNEGIQDRGGISHGLLAFTQEFKPDEPVRLLVKINTAYGCDLPKQLKEIGLENLPSNVEIITQSIPFNELVNFYNQGDVFVMPTRGEAFGLTCLEAMGCGLPCITTGFGGQTDFVNSSNGWLVGYKLEPVTHSISYEGTQWATPDLAHLKCVMREAFNNHALVNQKGAKALADSKLWSWQHSAEKAVKALKLLECQ